MEYVEITQTCSECGRGLPCYLEARPGFAFCEPDYAVPCRHCGKTVRLELPGPPVDITPPRGPSFPRWPVQGLNLAWRTAHAADLVRHVLEEHRPELCRGRTTRPSVG